MSVIFQNESRGGGQPKSQVVSEVEHVITVHFEDFFSVLMKCSQ